MEAGIVPRMRLDKSRRARSLVRSWGLTPAGASELLDLRYPDRAAIIDELGTLTFAEVHERTDGLAHAFQAAGIDHQDTVAIMCRNHRGFIEATIACSKLGADLLYLDPATKPAVLADLIRREDPQALIYDDEFSALLRPLGHGRRCFIAWCDRDGHSRHPLLEELIALEGSAAPAPSPKGSKSTVILACPAPGRTHGARRKLLGSLMMPAAVLSRIPLQPREATMVAAPMFGWWGFLHFTLGLRLASTLVLRREFDPYEVLATASEHQVTALALQPEMLERIMELPQATSACHDTRALRVIAVQGAGLPSDVAMPAMKRFGDVLYGLGGTTVVQLRGDWARHMRPVGGPEWVGGEPLLSGSWSGEFAAH
jgi:fatty-acyl-CoA synthase